MTAQAINSTKQAAAIQPMPAKIAATWFGAYGLAIAIRFHWIMPRLPQFGLTSAESLVLVLIIPFALMLVPPLIIYQQSGAEMSLRAMLRHWRYPRIRASDFLWAGAIILIASLGSGAFMEITRRLIAAGWITIPSYTPALFNPLADLSDIETWNRFVGGNMRGNWSSMALYFTMLFFNITGEELLWRDYILPRQEAQHGRWAWLIHGLMWTLFHAFKWWDLLVLLPICLIIAYVSQRTGRNWPAFIAHYFINGIGFVMAVGIVAGWL